jgi:vacuolar-type H+-ATPase subunit E/Vma4
MQHKEDAIDEIRQELNDLIDQILLKRDVKKIMELIEKL